MKTLSKGAEDCRGAATAPHALLGLPALPTLWPAGLARLGGAVPQAPGLSVSESPCPLRACLLGTLQLMLQFDQPPRFPRLLHLIPGGHALVFRGLCLIGIYSASCITLHPIMRSANICWGTWAQGSCQETMYEKHSTLCEPSSLLVQSRRSSYGKG